MVEARFLRRGVGGLPDLSSAGIIMRLPTDGTLMPLRIAAALLAHKAPLGGRVEALLAFLPGAGCFAALSAGTGPNREGPR